MMLKHVDLPVVSEANDVNMDRCSHENGLNFEMGSVADFRKKIMYFAQMQPEKISNYRKKCSDICRGKL